MVWMSIMAKTVIINIALQLSFWNPTLDSLFKLLFMEVEMLVCPHVQKREYVLVR